MGKLYAYVEEIVTQRTIKPNTFASYALEALDCGEITLRECIGIVGGYATASLDTSANGVAAMFLMLAQHPEQWAMVRAEPELALSAVREILRLETPAAWFCRVTTREVTFDDLVIPANTRLIHSYAAANRDERAFRDPGRFDVRRDPTQALTWGYGIHVCPGQFISVMELTALLRAMTQRIEHIELTGEPVRRVHNMTRGLESLPMRVTGK